MGSRNAKRAAAALLVGCAVAASISACSLAGRQQPSEVTAAVAGALVEAHSAAETTRLTVALFDRGRVPGPVADTALYDQLQVLDEADRALATMVTTDATSSERRASGLAAVGDVTDVVVTARQWVAARAGGDVHDGSASADELLAEVGAAADKADEALVEAGGR